MAVKAGAVLGAFLALTASAASAQTHQYVLTAQGPDQATILDLASRTQREVTLSFNVTLLRKTPAHLPGVGLDVYWGDGVLQIECLDHHTRFMLMTGYTLDRGRRFDEPSPAFHPWSDNAEGTPARALEEFVCRGRGAASFARIDDLGAFTRGFVGGQAVASAPAAPARAAPPQAAPAAAATDSLAIGLPGDHPAPKGMSRYYAVSADEDGALLLDMTSTLRRGEV
ncbi:MAG TPA: hypothetical protein VKQ70_02065, partial [Caulobacteraceae bacterium]|nr:hypothetical protein [Caulobacteraceae bacterium]